MKPVLEVYRPDLSIPGRQASLGFGPFVVWASTFEGFGFGAGVRILGTWIQWEVEREHVRRCRECGCTDLEGCIPHCWWIEDDLCSSHGTAAA